MLTSLAAAAATIAGCPLFPADVLDQPARRRAARHARLGRDRALDRARRDAEGRLRLGPVGGRADRNPVRRRRPRAPRVASAVRVRDESDRVRYPIPPGVHIEGGPNADGDRHALLVDRARCKLYELFALRREGGRWTAGSGATWSLRRPRMRPSGWTSADAAGLPILPLLARYQEVRRGRITHALRMTVSQSAARVRLPRAPLRVLRDRSGAAAMGERLRLKASVDIAGLPRQARVVARAMKEYGLIVADNGSDWFVVRRAASALGQRPAAAAGRGCAGATSRSSVHLHAAADDAEPAPAGEQVEQLGADQLAPPAAQRAHVGLGLARGARRRRSARGRRGRRSARRRARPRARAPARAPRRARSSARRRRRSRAARPRRAGSARRRGRARARRGCRARGGARRPGRRRGSGPAPRRCAGRAWRARPASGRARPSRPGGPRRPPCARARRPARARRARSRGSRPEIRGSRRQASSGSRSSVAVGDREALLARPLEPPALAQPALQLVGERQQVLDVLARVAELLGRQRARVPARERGRLREPDLQHVVQQARVARLRGEAGEAGRDLRVEHVRERRVPRAAQDRDVLAAGVQHDLDRRDPPAPRRAAPGSPMSVLRADRARRPRRRRRPARGRAAAGSGPLA